MWAELTDRYELKPEERPTTLALMRRAAEAWPADPAVGAVVDAYLDRWMFDVLGLDRTIGREF